MLACIAHVLALADQAAPHPAARCTPYFGRRSRGQQLDQKKYARPETLARLSPAARFILDV